MQMAKKCLPSIAIFFFFSACPAPIRGALTSTPANIAVKEGTRNVTLNCSTDETRVDWVAVPFASQGGNVLNQLTDAGRLVYPFNASYAIDRPSPDAFNLVVLTATATASSPGDEPYSTAGIYRCFTPQLAAAASQVIVVQSGPKCALTSSNQTNDSSTRLMCTFTYAAIRAFTHSIDAVLNWNVDGALVTDAVFTVDDSSSSTGITATSVVIRDARQASGDKLYECVASFSPPVNDPPSQIASNAPYYEQRCSIYSSSTSAATTTATITTTTIATTTTTTAATTTTTTATTAAAATTTRPTSTPAAEDDSQQSSSLTVVRLASVLCGVVGLSVLVCFTFYFRFRCALFQRNSQRIVDHNM